MRGRKMIEFWKLLKPKSKADFSFPSVYITLILKFTFISKYKRPGNNKKKMDFIRFKFINTKNG